MTSPELQRSLMLVAESPHPPTSGGRRRSDSIARALNALGSVALLAADDPASGPEVWQAAVDRYRSRRMSSALRARDVAVGILLRRHTILVRAEAAGLADAFERLVVAGSPDVVVLGRPFVRPFAQVARAFGAKTIVDADEWMGRLQRQVVREGGSVRARVRAAIEVYTLSPMERRWYAEVDQVWVSSDVEAAHFRRWLTPERVVVVPNAAPAIAEPEGSAGEINAVCFVGSYGHAPNEAAALELMRDVMPAIRTAGGPEQLVLVGRDPTPAMRAAADPWTTITGEVTDTTPHLRSAGILVAPIHAGGGTRVKLLEAAAAGVPIVASRLAAEGLPFVARDSILFAESPSEFGAAVRELRADPRLRARVVEGGRALAAAQSQQSVNAAVAAALSRLGTPSPQR